MRASTLLLVGFLVVLSVTNVYGRSGGRPVRHHPDERPIHHRPTHPGADPIGPSEWCLTFQTDVKTVAGSNGQIIVNITRSLAPLGSDRLFALVNDNFFDSDGQLAAFFRVVPQFVVQFGISGNPPENTKWNVPIQDDPVLTSNIGGTLVYATAGPNTRTTQLFINYVDNPSLDSQGFAPFGMVVQGMDVANAIFNPTPNNTDGVNQWQYLANGNLWIQQNFPGINSITGTTFTTSACSI